LVILVGPGGCAGVGAAKPIIASQTPIEQRRKAKKIRGLKPPDSGEEFFRIVVCGEVLLLAANVNSS
jgi:hypothetical protein